MTSDFVVLHISNQCFNLKYEAEMYKYWILVRINSTQTAQTYIWADNDGVAKMIAEAQYGVGNVLNYSQVSD
jgi:hypothetical protein